MIRGRFRPGVGPTLCVLVMLPILLGLGVWQCYRLAWKRALIAQITAQMAQPPQTLPTVITVPEEWSFRPVTVTGVFDAGFIAAFPARMHNGVLGGKMIQLLRRENGPAVLVDRGWVPQSVLDDLKKAKNLSSSDVRSISGLVRLPEPGNIFTPDNQPKRGWWYRPDPRAMAEYAQAGPVLPLWIEQSSPDPNGPVVLPIRGASLPNNHLGYALTWFGLAAGLLVIYVIHGFRQVIIVSARQNN